LCGNKGETRRVYSKILKRLKYPITCAISEVGVW
jgi:hypothetical protein